MELQFLILPGYNNSDQNHWQSIWEEENKKNYHRVNQNNWNHPVCSDWVRNLDEAMMQYGDNIIIVAHSLACLLVAFWASSSNKKIRGALLVAPPDPDSAVFPETIKGFENVPKVKFGFPSYLIASDNDKYATLSFSMNCAKNWGSKFILVKNAGHINSESDLGDWPFGKSMLNSLIKETEARFPNQD